MLPRESCKFISDNSKYVSLNDSKIKELSNQFMKILGTSISMKNWLECNLHPNPKLIDAVSWIFFIDTINFSFWPDVEEKKYNVKYHGKLYTGYWSICAALNRALDKGIPCTKAEFMKNITIDTFKEIFYPSENGNEIPLINERVKALNEAGNILIEKFGGDFSNCIKLANNSAIELLKLIVSNFSSYRDEAEFKGKTVTLYKRAQIVIADIWSCFQGEGLGKFYDIDQLTAFADYRVPQVLVYYGAIQYSEELMNLLNNDVLLENGSEQEVEIRGVTLECVETIVSHMKELLKKENKNEKLIVNSILVDNFLWDYRRKEWEELNKVPFHKTRTIYY